MESAHFSYSRAFAIWHYVLLPVHLLMFLTLGLTSIYMLTRAKNYEEVFVSLGALAAAGWVIAIFWQWIRYRHAVRQRYTLDSRGVLVESEDGTEQLSWADFNSAEYLRIPGMLRLTSSRLQKRVFLFLDHGFKKRQDMERNKTAEKLVETHLRDRYTKRWVL